MVRHYSAHEDKFRSSIGWFVGLVMLASVINIIGLVSIEKDPTNAWIWGLSRVRFAMAAAMTLLSLISSTFALKFGLNKPWSTKISLRIYEALQSKVRMSLLIGAAAAVVSMGILTIFVLLTTSSELMRAIILRLAPIIILSSMIGSGYLFLFPRYSQGWLEIENEVRQKISNQMRKPDQRQSLFRVGEATWHPWLDVFIILGLAAIVIIVKNNIGSFIIDDAWISFRYAKNLANGEGLTWEPAAATPTEGYSNLLAVLYISLALYWGIDPVRVSQGVGFISTVVILGSVYFQLMKITGKRLFVLIPLLFYAAHPFASIHTWSGLATQLFVALNALIYLFLWLTLENKAKRSPKWRVWGVVMVTTLSILATLTRTEGVVVGFLAVASGAIFGWKENRKPWIWGFISYLVVFSGYYLLRWLYFGTLFTGPYLVKLSEKMFLGVVASQEFLMAGREFLQTFPLAFFTMVLFPIGAYFVLKSLFNPKNKDLSPADLAVLSLALVQLCALMFVYARTNMIQNFASRFLVQSAAQQFFIVVLAGAGVYKGFQKFILDPQRNWMPGLLFILIMGFCGWSAGLWMGKAEQLYKSHERFVREYNYQQNAAKAIADVFGAHQVEFEGEWLVTVVDSGILPYFAEMNTIGGDGLTDANLSELVPPSRDKEGAYAGYIFQHNPGIFVIEVFNGHMLPHHQALICAPGFESYDFIAGIERKIGNTYAVYLRNDLPGYESISEQISDLNDPQKQFLVSFESPETSCPR